MLAGLAVACGNAKTDEAPRNHVVAPERPRAPELHWETDETAAFARAAREHKGVLVNFTVTWSVPSQHLDRALEKPEVVRAYASRYVPLRVDVSEATDAQAEMRERYGAKTLPFVVLVDVDRTVRGHIDHLVEPDELAAWLEAH